MSHAIVSVIAVNIQFNSPLGVLRSFSLPGIFSAKSGFTSAILKGFCRINHRNAMTTGVVRHAVNISAGHCGDNGKFSLALHAANTIIGPSIDDWMNCILRAALFLVSESSKVFRLLGRSGELAGDSG